MQRFTTKTWWTFILTLVLGVGIVAFSSNVVRADGTDPWLYGDGSGGGTPTSPNGVGDPDIPTKPAQGIRPGYIYHTSSPATLTTRGYVTTPTTARLGSTMQVRLILWQWFRMLFVR